MKIIYKAIGITSLLIGTLGAFVPLLPSTCFFLLSAWCFSKSSPRWHQALRENRIIGKTLINWEKNRTIPANAQRFAVISMLLSGTYSVVSFDSMTIKLIVLAVVSVSVWAICQLPTTEKSSSN